MSAAFDLHTHTVFSDGTTTPEENAALAAVAMLGGVALTDHDTAAGWERMRAACHQYRLEFVPGVELSTELEQSMGGVEGASVHILGYWVDPTHPELAAECERLRGEREQRARRVVARLGELGVTIDWTRVEAAAGDAPVGRPHIAAALIEAGVVPDIDTAFDEYLADGGPAWVPKHALPPVRGVELVRAAGGAAVLAHPGLTFPLPGPEATALLDALTAAGLAGVEADHPGHDPNVAARWRAAAQARELLVTGCSDFHGGRKPVRMGERSTPAGVVGVLRERAPGAPTEQEDQRW